jgi:hypothetical protein
LREKDLKLVDVRPERQARYNETIQARLAKTVWNTGGCTSWYRNHAGKNTTLWPGFTVEFRARLRRFDPAAYELVSHRSPRPETAANPVSAADAAPGAE